MRPTALRLISSGLLVALVAACTPAAPASPTTAPAPTSAPAAKPTTAAPAATTAPAAKPTTAPAASPVTKPADGAEKPSAGRDFSGETIRVVVSASAGGPSDTFARSMAEHLAKHVPGNPTFVVENMPGAGGILATNYVYNQAEPDGLTMLVCAGPAADQIFGAEGVNFDIAQYQWIGGVTETSVGYAHESLGVTNAEEFAALDTEIVVGGLGPAGTKDQVLRTFMKMLDLEHRYVPGYPGNAELRLAALRGEVHFTEESLTGYMSGILPLVESGEAYPIGQRGIARGGAIVRDPRLPDVPTYLEIAEEAMGEDVKTTVEYRAMESLVQIGAVLRSILYPPETDAATVDTMREALSDMFADPEFQAATEAQLGFKYEPVPGEEAQDIAEQVIRTAGEDAEAIDFLKEQAQTEE